MKQLRSSPVSTGLTVREKAAVVSYAEHLGVSVSLWLRSVALPEVPPEFWEPVQPPKGQLTIEEA